MSAVATARPRRRQRVLVSATFTVCRCAADPVVWLVAIALLFRLVLGD